MEAGRGQPRLSKESNTMIYIVGLPREARVESEGLYVSAGRTPIPENEESSGYFRLVMCRTDVSRMHKVDT